MTDDELKSTLETWKAPEIPHGQESRLLSAYHDRASGGFLRWLWSGSIRVPVPAAMLVLVAVTLWAIYLTRPRPVAIGVPGESVSMTEFQPVRALRPTVVRAN
jgi:hypothetical protein